MQLLSSVMFLEVDTLFWKCFVRKCFCSWSLPHCFPTCVWQKQHFSFCWHEL